MNKKLISLLLSSTLSLQSCKFFRLQLFPNTKPLDLENVVYTCEEMPDFKVYNFTTNGNNIFKTRNNVKYYTIGYSYKKTYFTFSLYSTHKRVNLCITANSSDYITYKDNDHKYSIVIGDDEIWKKYSGKTLNIIATDLGENYSVSHTLFFSNYSNDFYKLKMYYNYSCGELTFNNKTTPVVTYYEEDNSTFESYSIIDNKKGDFLYSGYYDGDQNKTTYHITKDNFFSNKITSFDIYQSDESKNYFSDLIVDDDKDIERIKSELGI